MKIHLIFIFIASTFFPFASYCSDSIPLRAGTSSSYEPANPIITTIYDLLLSDEKNDLIQYSKYLPLILGNKWVMRSNTSSTTLTYEVTQSEEGIYLLTLNNPWNRWETYLYPLNKKIYVSRMAIDNDDYFIGGLSLYFDFDSPKGSQKSVALGRLVILETDKSITIGNSLYTNCIELELIDNSDISKIWTFAPNIGFVEFSFNNEIYRLDKSASIIKTTPSNDTISWTVPVSKEDRILSIDINTASNTSFLSAFTIAKDVGSMVNGVHLAWDALETSSLQNDHQEIDNINEFYSQQNTGITLSISPIHSVTNNLPSDLKALSFDNPVVIERYKKMLDYIKDHLASVNIISLTIGNEIDAYLKDDSQKWLEYQNFYSSVASYARSILPNTKISTEFTFMQGYLGGAKPFIKEINKISDIIGVSYYPRDSEGLVLNPRIVHQNFKTLSNAFPGKPIYIFQLGYPSGNLLESSEGIQEDFIKQVFMAWDDNKEHIKLIDFTFLHDFTEEEIELQRDYFEQYDNNFGEFLRSVGLRKLNNEDKLSFSTLRDESSKRNWH